MKHLGKRSIVIGGVVALVAVGLAVGAYALHLPPWDRPPETLDLGPVIARVDGRAIHLHEAQARVEGLSTVHGDFQEALGERWPEQILQSLVDDQILLEQAKELGITVSDEDVRAYVDRVEGMIGADQSFDEWLAGQGLSVAELERRATLQLVGARVYLTVTEDVTVTGDELQAYYREHRTDFQETDGTIPTLLELRRSLRETLLKQEQDEAYAAWLQDVRDQAEVVVVMDEWWRNV
jgi:parvulin-like peptidyl-prolyl isomerase